MYLPCVLASTYDIITAGASIATCASALIALFAVWEIKKQRRSSYKPELFLALGSSMSAVIKRVEDEDSGIEYRQYNNDEQVDLEVLHFSIENIGFGAAKDVKVKWQFDFIEALTKVRILNPAGEGDNDLYLEVRNGKGETFCASWLDQGNIEPITYDFVLPRSQERFNLGAFIPTEITDLFVAYAILKMDILNDKRLEIIYTEEFDDFPLLRAQLSYQDIGNQSYKKNFVLKLSVSSGPYHTVKKLSHLNELVFRIHHKIEVC